MSLIEQAAKRLAELQRAGAAVATGSVATVADVPSRPVTARQPAEAPPASRRQRVIIDLAHMRELGFVTPEARISKIAQEMRVLKRPILRAATDAGTRRLMVTSALPGEGKTFTAINLALSIASEIDTTVTLVDGDVAHPAVQSLLGLPSSAGLMDLLTRDDLDVDDVLLDTNVPGLTLLPSGAPSAQATELLASDKMTSLVARLTAKFPGGIMVFDSPPLLATTEARVLASHMGQVILVVAANSTSRGAVLQALATVERCETVYTVLNKAVASDSATYGGHYSYGAHPGHPPG